MNKLFVYLTVLCAPLSLFAQSESLLIGPGDLLHVQFYDTPEMDQHPRVSDDGKVALLFLGGTRIAGKTPSQAAEMIRDLTIAKQVMRHPQVMVTIEQYATQSVTVTGEIAKPGAYSINTPRPIVDVLALAGGLTDAADRDVTLIRRDRSVSPLHYVVSNEKVNATAADLMVCPGDSVIVRRVGFIYVFGDVQRPGRYPMSTNDSKLSFLQVLAESGSPNKTAVLSKTKILRKAAGGYYEVTVRLDRLETGATEDVTLEADDVIFVPFSYAKTFILNSTAIAASVGSATIAKY